MSHADTLRGMSARGTPFKTTNASVDELNEIANYIDGLEFQAAQFVIENARLRRELNALKEKNESSTDIARSIGAT
jgi:cell division septum initiation protein DivIVA